MVFAMWLLIVVMFALCAASMHIVMVKEYYSWLEGGLWCLMFFVGGFGIIMAIRELIGEGTLL